MRACDKLSYDPAKHLGPFKYRNTYEDDEGERISAEQCEACGNIVLRELPKEKELRNRANRPRL